MAKVTAYELVAKFTGDTTGLQRSIAAAQFALSAISSSLGLTTAGFGVTAAAAIAFGIKSVRAIDDVANAAARLDLSTRAFQGYKYAADLAGQSIQDFVKNGSVGLQQAQADAERLGIIFDESLVAKAQKVRDNMITLGATIRNNFQSGLVSGFVDEFSDFTDQAANPELAKNIRNIGEAVGTLGGWALQAANSLGGLTGKLMDFYTVRARESARTSAMLEAQFSPKTVTEYKDQWNAEAKILADHRVKEAAKAAAALEKPTFNTNSGGRRSGGGRSGGGSGRSGAGTTRQATTDLKDYNNESREALNLIREMQREQESYNNSVADTFISFKDGVQQGKSAMESFRSVALNVINDVLNNMIKIQFGGTSGGGLAGAIAEGLSGLFSNDYDPAKSAPPRKPFAKGGVISGATVFPIGGNHGVMGEKGAEAIMPLVRGANGKLGVQSNGGGGGSIVQNINITTGVQQTVRAEIQRLLPAIASAATGNTQDAAKRNKVLL